MIQGRGNGLKWYNKPKQSLIYMNSQGRVCSKDKNQHPPRMGGAIDYHEKTEYDYRVLDALAAILNLQTPCTAVMRDVDKKHKFYVSYNNNISLKVWKMVQSAAGFINNFIADDGQTHMKSKNIPALIGMYIAFNDDFKKLFDPNNTFVGSLRTNSKTLELIAKITQHRNELIGFKLDSIKSEEFKRLCCSIAEDYFHLLSEVAEENATNEQSSLRNESLLNFLKRPVKDVLKSVVTLKKEAQDDNSLKTVEIEILNNPEGLHAEMVLLKKALKDFREGSRTTFEFYMGISKLCCYLCHRTLDLLKDKIPDLKVITRGTHNTFYIGWILPDKTLKSEIDEVLKEVEEEINSTSGKHKSAPVLMRQESSDETLEEEITLLSKINDIIKPLTKPIAKKISDRLKALETLKKEIKEAFFYDDVEITESKIDASHAEIVVSEAESDDLSENETTDMDDYDITFGTVDTVGEGVEEG
ncbi:hypothetical protein phytr_1140 [Candidatus Phycorickettsia trachydisci]|uniref:Uncharacterized protein n=1 Tax=Candidatus Phycorickettsia trachydisci TaxID=2115978 RepID=A0A2P1P754_9RICK|nr:nucleic acid/nucleotide deaminase domain-containing protein [Candidatus Phycorickettsia trachydisci]AVP87075.1 hypothetical protein phytr_1140 [Candidatus Phycorickettsia trachydisci]